MRRLIIGAAPWVVLAAFTAHAAVYYPPAAAVDTSNLVTQAQMSALAATMPQPSDVAPPADVNGGSIGTGTTYSRANAARPRITRSITVTLAADGTVTADWTNNGGALPAPAVVLLTPILTPTSGAPKCWLTATPTTTSAPIKCVVEQNTLNLTLATITAGVNVNGGSAAGMKVQVLALPPS